MVTGYVWQSSQLHEMYILKHLLHQNLTGDRMDGRWQTEVKWCGSEDRKENELMQETEEIDD